MERWRRLTQGALAERLNHILQLMPDDTDTAAPAADPGSPVREGGRHRLAAAVRAGDGAADFLTQRGGTLLLDADDTLLVEHRDRGILGHSKTMGQPMRLLEGFLGDGLDPADRF